MCFDISHSFLTCNHFKYNFEKFTEEIAPLTAHIHIGDGIGVNGEGLQVGEGEINFINLGKTLINKSKSIIHSRNLARPQK